MTPQEFSAKFNDNLSFDTKDGTDLFELLNGLAPCKTHPDDAECMRWELDGGAICVRGLAWGIEKPGVPFSREGEAMEARIIEAFDLEESVEKSLKGKVYRPNDKNMPVGTNLSVYGFHKKASLGDDQIEIWNSLDRLTIAVLSTDGDGYVQVLSTLWEVVEAQRDFMELLKFVLSDEAVN